MEKVVGILITHGFFFPGKSVHILATILLVLGALPNRSTTAYQPLNNNNNKNTYIVGYSPYIS